MPWDILTSASIVSGQQFVPDTYAAVTSSITVPNTAGGIVLVAADATNTTRFINVAVEPKLASGSKILVYVGIGFTPTAALHSFIWTSGYQDNNLLINGQEIRALAQSGQTININVQVANGVKR